MKQIVAARHWLICAQVVELKFLDARGAFDKKGHGDVPIWAMMSETS